VSADVIITGDLSRAVREFLARSETAIVREVVLAADRVATEAQAGAPVKTGRFRGSIESYVQAGQAQIRAGVRVGGATAPYARYVRFSRRERAIVGPIAPGAARADLGELRGTAYQLLVQRPMRLESARLVAALGQHLRAAWGR
jgi:hypothetical protein